MTRRYTYPRKGGTAHYIVHHMPNGFTVADVAQQTGSEVYNVRTALRKLMRMGMVTHDGGKPRRHTVVSRQPVSDARDQLLACLPATTSEIIRSGVVYRQLIYRMRDEGLIRKDKRIWRRV